MQAPEQHKELSIDKDLYIKLAKLTLYDKNIEEYGGKIENNKVVKPGAWGCVISNHIIGVAEAQDRGLWWRCKYFPKSPDHYHNAPLHDKIDLSPCPKCSELFAGQPVIISSRYQTKEWRLAQPWYIDGKRNECELEQRRLFPQITGFELNKMNGHRLHLSKLGVYEIHDPNTSDDGFEYTEDFDGGRICSEYKYYFNLKFICNKGGAQTRSLRLVYIHIKRQIDNLLHEIDDNHTYYINILDGDGAYNSRDKFRYLLDTIPDDKKEFIGKFFFVGDMKEFQYWWRLSIVLNHNSQEDE